MTPICARSDASVRLFQQPVRQRCRSKLSDPFTHPFRHRAFRCLTGSHGFHDTHNLHFIGLEPHVIEFEEDHGRQECDALVSIAEGVMTGDTKQVSGRQHCEVGLSAIRPLVLRPGEGSLERIFISEPAQTAVSPDLIKMHGFNHEPWHPLGFSHGARLFCELPQRVAIPFGRALRDGQGLLRYRVVGCQENALIRLDG